MVLEARRSIYQTIKAIAVLTERTIMTFRKGSAECGAIMPTMPFIQVY
jgi:hypothetical protein